MISKYCILLCFINAAFCLYPYESSTRTKISLNGLWEFKVDFQNEGIKNNWQTKVFKNQVSFLSITY
jgi:beta-galactosidase/beta-glucuronidase